VIQLTEVEHGEVEDGDEGGGGLFPLCAHGAIRCEAARHRESCFDAAPPARGREAMMEVSIEHLGDLQFEITARTHTIACDQPIENGGYDEGVTPPELLLASLGSCAAYYAAEYLRRQKLATEGTRVRVTAEKAKNPPRLAGFHIEVDLPVDVSEEHRAGVEAAVHRCLIHNTLLQPPRISVEIRQLATVAA
jgi:putative redox protein